MKEKEFKIRITARENPACFGKECEGEHHTKYLVIKTKNKEWLYQEGHPIYRALFSFAMEQPEVFADAYEVRIHAKKGAYERSMSQIITGFERELDKI